jgi:hypothetical protein
VLALDASSTFVRLLDLRFRNTASDRVDARHCLAVRGTNNQVVNCVFENCHGFAMSVYSAATLATIYGNIMYHNGLPGAGATPPTIMSQNAESDGRDLFENNIILRGFKYENIHSNSDDSDLLLVLLLNSDGFHMSTTSGEIEAIDLLDNIVGGAGTLTTPYNIGGDIALGGKQPLEYIVVRNNVAFTPASSRGGTFALSLGSADESENVDVTVEDNYLLGYVRIFKDFKDLVFRR